MKKRLFHNFVIFILITSFVLVLLPVYEVEALELSSDSPETVLTIDYSIPTLEENFSDDQVIVILKPGYGGVNKEISVDDFSNANIILEQDIEENTDIEDKIVIVSIDDLTHLENPEMIEDAENFLQIISFTLKEKSKSNVINLIKNLQSVECVLSATADYNYTIDSLSTNDEFQGEQWGLSDDGIAVSEGWDLIGDGYTFPAIRVGIFEAGVQVDHPDLHVVQGNFTPSTTVSLEHGTHVAGIIGANSGNNIGIAGVAKVEIAVLNVESFVESLAWAIDNDIRVVNASFGFINRETKENAAPNASHISAIYNFGLNGGILVCASGNEEENTDINPLYPAAYSNSDLFPNITNVISVGSIDENGDRSLFSNYGLDSVDIYAPGSNVLSTFPEDVCRNHDEVFSDGTRMCELSVENRNLIYAYVEEHDITLDNILNNFDTYFRGAPSDYVSTQHHAVGYHYMDGTSMAAPHVTGVVALLLSVDPNLTVSQITQTILNSADTISIVVADDLTQDAKNLNATNAVKYLLTHYSVPPITVINGTSKTFNSTIDSTGTCFYEMNSFIQLDVVSAGIYNFQFSSTNALTVVLYDSDLNELNFRKLESLNNGTEKAGYCTLSVGIYYLKVKYTDSSNSGTISITIEPHVHDYDGWTYHNAASHIETCCCGAKGTDTANHAVLQSEIVNNRATCLGCKFLLNLTLHSAVIQSTDTLPVSQNGSYLLPSGVAVLVDEDLEAFYNGTLIFYDPEDSLQTE